VAGLTYYVAVTTDHNHRAKHCWLVE
jgi:hypothetical protein